MDATILKAMEANLDGHMVEMPVDERVDALLARDVCAHERPQRQRHHLVRPVRVVVDRNQRQTVLLQRVPQLRSLVFVLVDPPLNVALLRETLLRTNR